MSAGINGKTETRAGKYLTFGLGTEHFAIQVPRVREIMGVPEITRVPRMPGYVKGVMNLRGKVIPVVDLRLKLGLAEQPYCARTCVIVVETARTLAGVVVDEVWDVLNIPAADIEDTPEFAGGGSAPYLLGMAKIKGKVKILLDIDQVMGATGGEGSWADRHN